MTRFIAPTAACLLLLLTGRTVSAEDIDTIWTRHFAHSLFDSVTSLAPAHDGGFIITGRAKEMTETYSDILLAKTDSLGHLEWSRRIGNPAWEDAGFHVLPTNDLGCLISGWSDAATGIPGNTRLWIVKTDSAGDTLWTFSHDPLNRSSMALAAVQTYDSGFAVTGLMNRGGTGNDAFILRLTKTGGFQWIEFYGGDTHDDGCFITELPDSNLLMAGHKDNRYVSNSGYDWHVVRTSRIGTIWWDSCYTLSLGHDELKGACLLDDGLVMAGLKSGAGHALKIDLNGHTVWSKSISVRLGDERNYSVCRSAEGGVMVGGWVGVDYHRRDFHYLKLTDSGDTAWTFTVGGAEDDHGRTVVQTADGGYVMAGTTFSWPPGTMVYLTKINAPALPGDVDNSGSLNVADVTFLIAYIFRGGPAPANSNAADVTGDCSVKSNDITYLIAHIFRDGPAPLPGCVD